MIEVGQSRNAGVHERVALSRALGISSSLEAAVEACKEPTPVRSYCENEEILRDEAKSREDVSCMCYRPSICPTCETMLKLPSLRAGSLVVNHKLVIKLEPDTIKDNGRQQRPGQSKPLP